MIYVLYIDTLIRSLCLLSSVLCVHCLWFYFRGSATACKKCSIYQVIFSLFMSNMFTIFGSYVPCNATKFVRWIYLTSTSRHGAVIKVQATWFVRFSDIVSNRSTICVDKIITKEAFHLALTSFSCNDFYTLWILKLWYLNLENMNLFQ